MPERPYPDGVEAVFAVARRLREPVGGCPWDREQTHLSLRPYLLEETYELLEAIDQGHDDERVMEELGDVLLQVAMHSAIAEEGGRFDGARVSEAAAAKMVARHPHVFGDEEVADAEDVLRHWEARKAAEPGAAGRPGETVLDRVPAGLPALAWTFNMQKRAARVGLDLDALSPAAAAAPEPAAGPESFQEVGDLLFSLVSLSRRLKVNPEDALRAAGQRFKARFERLDGDLRERGAGYRDLDPSALAEAWERTR